MLNFDLSQMMGGMDAAMGASMMGQMQNFMGGGGMGGAGQGYGQYDQQQYYEQQQGPSMEQQIAAAKPMLKNIDATTKKFIDTHCHIDTMYKKEQFQGDWDTYRLVY